jgi:hypothetical protein
MATVQPHLHLQKRLQLESISSGLVQGFSTFASRLVGIHQLASPSSRISAGTSRARITVASRMIPAARPIAKGLTS